jgi:pimeloyl-ACP methyl ester carboxylesterase
VGRPVFKAGNLIMTYNPYVITTPQAALDDLRGRLRRTRWPDEVQGAGWDYGVPVAFLRDLTSYWAETFDWRAQEDRLNSFANYRIQLTGLGIHFIYELGRGPHPIPLLITHGWPSSFLEMLELIPLLTDPARHGGDPADAFDVIIPSIPGYAFSDPPLQRGFSYPDIAGLWIQLMDALGYARFGAHAHDHGAAVMTHVLVKHPERVIGYHTTEPSIPGPNLTLDSPDLSVEERAFLEIRSVWRARDDGYARVQSTRPQTLAYGLNDSPAGLAAWLLDKWYAWTAPPSGNLEDSFSRDFLLSTVTLYWLTETVNATARAYFEGAHDPRRLPPDFTIQVPTGVSLGATQAIERPPREFAARRFRDIRYWIELGRGGHFLAGEEPAVLAESLRAFFRMLR